MPEHPGLTGPALIAAVRDQLASLPVEDVYDDEIVTDFYNQGDWFRTNLDYQFDSPMAALLGVREGKCNTAGCAAGWAVILHARSLPTDAEVADLAYDGGEIDWAPTAQRLLGITERQAAWLFAGHRDERLMPAMFDYLLAHPDARTLELTEHYERLGGLS